MKTTTNLSLILTLAMASASATFGDAVIQTTVTTVTTDTPAAVAVVRDGFTYRNFEVMVTRHGVSRVMENAMKLHNGVVVKRDGTIVVPGKMNKSLNSGDWLAYDGTLTRADTGKVENLRPAD